MSTNEEMKDLARDALAANFADLCITAIDAGFRFTHQRTNKYELRAKNDDDTFRGVRFVITANGDLVRAWPIGLDDPPPLFRLPQLRKHLGLTD